MRLVVFGAGFSGRAILRAAEGVAASRAGTTRAEENMADIAATGALPCLYCGEGFPESLRQAMAAATHLIMSIAPDASATPLGGDPLLADLEADLRRHFPKLAWIGYLSTVGVYGNHDGAWVDETTPCRPVSRRSRARLAAEQAWQRAAEGAGVPLAVLRLSGIYGPGRNAFVSLAAGTARRLVKPGQVFNRVHVGDIAGAALFLAGRNLGGIFNVTDDFPAPPQDVVARAAEMMGVAPPPETDFDTAEMTPMARSFYGENKRVSNARIRGLGYRFDFPDYRAGLADLIAGNRWRGST